MKIKFFNTFINLEQKESYLEKFVETFSNNKKIFYYLNSYSFYLINKYPYYREIFNKADFISADGYSIVFACKKIFHKKIEKINVSRFILEELIPLWTAKNYKIFILGGEEKFLKIALKNIRKNFPDLNISGSHNGFFQNEENNSIVDKINNTSADILLVGMGMPLAEKWIDKNIESLNVKYILTVGAFIDLVAGKTKIAPKLFDKSGLEWLFRLIQEPRRLFSRYAKANFFFLKIFMLEFFRRRFLNNE